MTKEEILAEISDWIDRKQTTSLRAYTIYVVADQDRVISKHESDPTLLTHPLTSVIEAAIVGSAFDVNPQAVLNGMFYLARHDAIGKPRGVMPPDWKAMKLEDSE